MKNYQFYKLLHSRRDEKTGRRMTTTLLAEKIGSSRSHVTEVLNNVPGHGGNSTRRKLLTLMTHDELSTLGWSQKNGGAAPAASAEQKSAAPKNLLDVEHLNKQFPKYPITVFDKGWIYGVWYCPTAWMRTHFYGQYPLTFLKRVLALFPDAKDILHCPSGTLTGPGVTVDLIRDAQRNPQYIASAEALPFEDDSFDIYLSDPPYSKSDSQKYGTPPFRSKVAMEEARRVLRPGGYYALLNTRYPSFRQKDWNFVALIAVVTGANRVVRLLSIFQKPVPKAIGHTSGSSTGNNVPI